MALWEEMKLRLRIRSDAFDEEIISLIDACKLDLQGAGVERIDEDDALIKAAVSLYLKANFGLSEDQERYREAYDGIKVALKLNGSYGGVPCTDATKSP
jgi:hypothetical protein